MEPITRKPRTKLVIRHIPPLLTEGEFRGEMEKYLELINYFHFVPGLLMKDAYGNYISLDRPRYGCAFINFRRHQDLPHFFREFNKKFLIDSAGIKSELTVDFALFQKISIDSQKSPDPLSNTLKDSDFYHKFLSSLPKKESTPIAVEEVKSNVVVDPNQVIELRMPTLPNFVEIVGKIKPNQSRSLPIVDFLLAQENSLLQAKKPITRQKGKEGKNGAKEKKKSKTRKEKAVNEAAREKANEKVADRGINEKGASLVQKPEIVLKGTPRILSRAQSNPAVVSSNQPDKGISGSNVGLEPKNQKSKIQAKSIDGNEITKKFNSESSKKTPQTQSQQRSNVKIKVDKSKDTISAPNHPVESGSKKIYYSSAKKTIVTQKTSS